jgi:hypothetical protein
MPKKATALICGFPLVSDHLKCHQHLGVYQDLLLDGVLSSALTLTIPSRDLTSTMSVSEKHETCSNIGLAKENAIKYCSASDRCYSCLKQVDEKRIEKGVAGLIFRIQRRCLCLLLARKHLANMQLSLGIKEIQAALEICVPSAVS